MACAVCNGVSPLNTESVKPAGKGAGVSQACVIKCPCCTAGHTFPLDLRQILMRVEWSDGDVLRGGYIASDGEKVLVD